MDKYTEMTQLIKEAKELAIREKRVITIALQPLIGKVIGFFPDQTMEEAVKTMKEHGNGYKDDEWG